MSFWEVDAPVGQRNPGKTSAGHGDCRAHTGIWLCIEVTLDAMIDYLRTSAALYSVIYFEAMRVKLK